MTPEMGGYTPADHKTRHQDGGRDEISIANLAGTPTELATHKADIDAHMVDWYQTLLVGNYIIPVPLGISLQTHQLVADRLYATPFIVARNITVDRIAVYCTALAAAAGKILRLGIYNDTGACYPDALQVDAGTVAVGSGDATGLLAITIDTTLTKGLHWLIFVSDGDPTFRAHRSVWSPLGFPAAEFRPDTRILKHYYIASIGAGALSATFPDGASTTYVDTTTVCCRLASLS